MIVKNVVVTGLLKVTRPLQTSEIITEEINGTTRQEISYLSGLTSNIQAQIQTTNTSISTAQAEQSQWKSDIANAINDIPNPTNNGELVSNANRSGFISHLHNIGTNIKSATAIADDVVSPAKFIDSNGNVVVGGLKDMSDYTDCDSIGIDPAHGSGTLYVRIPEGAYRTPTAASKFPEIRVSRSDLFQLIGLTEAKILKGNTVMGVAGTATSDANAEASHILKDKVAYANGQKVTGTMVNWTGTPDHITDARINNNRFEVAVHKGYHDWSWVNNSYEYMTYAEVASLIGLTAGKLLKGNTILGVIGSATGDANAAAGDIIKNKTAYVNGVKVTGSLEDKSDYTECVSAAMGGSTFYSRIPKGAYRTATTIGYPEITVANSKLCSAIGLTAAKILKGHTVAAVAGTATGDANATAAQILKDRTAYVNGVKVTGSMPERARSTKTTQVGNDGSKVYFCFPTGFYPALQCFDQKNSSEVYAEFATVAANVQLTAGKLLKGNTVMGVAGTATGDANATAGDIFKDKTAYVNGVKVTGTMSDKRNTTQRAAIYSVDDTYVSFAIPTAGFYDSTSRIRREKSEMSGLGSKIYYLGEFGSSGGTVSVDITKYYSDWAHLTVDNFVWGIRTIATANSQLIRDAGENVKATATGVTPSTSYNQSTGLLTIGCKQVVKLVHDTGAVVGSSATQRMFVRVYIVTGTIDTLTSS